MQKQTLLLVASLAAFAACTDRTPTSATPPPRDEAARQDRLAQQDGKRLEMRLSVLGANGQKTLLASKSVTIRHDRTNGRLHFQGSQAAVAQDDNPTQFFFPTMEESYSDLWTEVSAAPPPTPRTDLSANQVGLETYALPSDLYSDGIAAFEVTPAGRLQSGTIDAGTGHKVRTELHYANNVLTSIRAFVTLGGATTYVVDVDASLFGSETSPTDLESIPILPAALVLDDCWDKVQTAVGKSAKVGAEIALAGVAVYGAMNVVPAAAAVGFIYTYPAHREMTRRAWGLLAAAVAIAWDDVNEMRTAVSNAVSAC